MANKIMAHIRTWLGLNYYVSNLDQFLEEFDRTHPRLSLSQRQEMKKYARIDGLRDGTLKPKESAQTLWEGF